MFVLLHDTGYVIPTLGTRAHSLKSSLKSVLDAGVGSVALVAPSDVLCELRLSFTDPRLIYCVDKREGLSGAINQGMSALPKEVKFVNWLGDDDVLASGYLVHLRHALLQSQSTSLAYGKCIYLDSTGTSVFQTRARKIHVPLMRFGPQFVSQPASLFKREHFNAVGMLNPSLQYAFDLDLFIRLSRVGAFHAVPHVCAYFGWHNESLSVAARSIAAREASYVRLSHHHQAIRWLMRPYEQILRRVIFIAGRLVTLRSQFLIRTTRKVSADSA